jgi:hypothetical protein
MRMAKGLFISYRRGDSAGHAGRLFDGLKERFGAERVFMDVTDLRPGEDFVAALDTALRAADHLLVVIGPHWLDASDAGGRRRIDDPNDFVRREVVAGLSGGATVIPVLVHGAAMPSAEAMPPELGPLARRQAIALSDARWESDLRELIDVLGPPDDVAIGATASTAAASVPPRRFAGPLVAATLVLLLLAIAGWYGWRSSRGDAPEVATARPAATDGAVVGARTAPAAATARTEFGSPAARPGGTAAAPSKRFGVALPPVSEVRFRTGRAQLEIGIRALRLETLDDGSQALTVLVRMLNRGPLDEAFGSDMFHLIAGEHSIAATPWMNGLVEGNDAKETSLRFLLPRGAAEPYLGVVMVYAQRTRIPVPLTDRTTLPAADPTRDEFGRTLPPRVVDVLKTLPAALPAGQRVEAGRLGYEIVGAVIERETVETASLTLTVRCSAPARGGGANFWSSSVRLWVDGVPRAPVNAVNELVEPGASKEARFIFDFPAMPLQSLEAGFGHSDDHVKVPLRLDTLARR